MERILKQYKDLPPEDLGMLIKMIFDYIETGKADCKNPKTKVLFFTQTKKEIDKMLKERERKRGNKNGRK